MWKIMSTKGHNNSRPLNAPSLDPIIQHHHHHSHLTWYLLPLPLPFFLMEKTKDEMDLDEWDFVSDAGFLDHEDVGRGVLVSSKLDFNPKDVLDMDYFTYQSQYAPKPLDEEVVKEVVKVPIVETSLVDSVTGDQDMISQQVSFKKLKGNQFVDLKKDSLESGTREVIAQEAGSVQFMDKKEVVKEQDMETKTSSKDLVELDSNTKEVTKWEKGGGFNIWKWRISGIGALCSIGMAAATICIFIIGSQQRHKHQQQNQKLQFQIYTDDKRFKHVVHQASKLNQAVSSVRGGPFPGAHFTFGGHYVCDDL